VPGHLDLCTAAARAVRSCRRCAAPLLLPLPLPTALRKRSQRGSPRRRRQGGAQARQRRRRRRPHDCCAGGGQPRLGGRAAGLPLRRAGRCARRQRGADPARVPARGARCTRRRPWRARAEQRCAERTPARRRCTCTPTAPAQPRTPRASPACRLPGRRCVCVPRLHACATPAPHARGLSLAACAVCVPGPRAARAVRYAAPTAPGAAPPPAPALHPRALTRLGGDSRPRATRWTWTTWPSTSTPTARRRAAVRRRRVGAPLTHPRRRALAGAYRYGYECRCGGGFSVAEAVRPRVQRAEPRPASRAHAAHVPAPAPLRRTCLQIRPASLCRAGAALYGSPNRAVFAP
jgi:hypothetical protein